MFQPGFELLSCALSSAGKETKGINFGSSPLPFFPIGSGSIKVRHYYATYLSVHVILEKMVIR